MHQCPTQCSVDEDMLITRHHSKWLLIGYFGFLPKSKKNTKIVFMRVCGLVQEVVCLSVRSCNWRLEALSTPRWVYID